MNSFESRNNTSIVLVVCSDGSGEVREFWDSEEIESFKTNKDLSKFLLEATYKLSDNGRCISPMIRTDKQ